MRFYQRESQEAERAERTHENGAAAPSVPSLADHTSIAQGLAQALGDVPGALGLALIDPDAGEILGSSARGIDMAEVATLHIDLCRAASRIGDLVAGSGDAENLALTLGSQQQLILPLPALPKVWLCLVLDRQRGNVALARHQVSKIEARVTA